MGTAVVCLVVCDELTGIWMELEGELDVKLGRRCKGCESGSDCGKPIKLSTGSPSWKPFRLIRLSRRWATHPPTMLYELLPIHLIQPRDPYEVLLRLH